MIAIQVLTSSMHTLRRSSEQEWDWDVKGGRAECLGDGRKSELHTDPAPTSCEKPTVPAILPCPEICPVISL